MRWTDLPQDRPVRALSTWRDVLLAREPGADAAVAALVDRALHADAPPLVVVDAGAHAAALRHVSGSALERGGLLLGSPVAAGEAPEPILLVHVTGAVAGLDDEATPLSLRLGAAVWTRANAQLRPEERVVGWFHSHPGIGAFFSDTDRRTHAAFFAHAYSLGWVMDPLRGEHAWFLGPGAKAVRASSISLRTT